MSMRDKLAAIIEEMFVDGPYATAGAIIDALPEMISHLSEMLAERDAALARESALREALGLVSDQSLSCEIPEGYGPEISEDPEFHRGYDAAINLARAKLAGAP